VIVGSPGGESVEELLSQRPKDVIGSWLKWRIQEGPPSILHTIYSEGVSPGASSKISVK
jgi:hypothetical protein